MRAEGIEQNRCSSKVMDPVMNTSDKNMPEPTPPPPPPPWTYTIPYQLWKSFYFSQWKAWDVLDKLAKTKKEFTRSHSLIWPCSTNGSFWKINLIIECFRACNRQTNRSFFQFFLSFSSEIQLGYSKYKRMVEPQHFARDLMQASEMLCIYIACKTSWREIHLLNRFLQNKY